MKISTDVIREHEGAVAIWGNRAPGSLLQNPPATVENGRNNKVPVGELLAALSAGKEFCFDLILRIQIGGDREEMQLATVSANGASMPMFSIDNRAGELRKEIGVSLDPSLSWRGSQEPSKTSANLARFGEVEVDFRRMELRRSGKRVEATAQEFKTLQYFVSRPETVISREELLNQVWGYENYPTTRTVDNRIMKLRRKLERKPSQPIHFLTVHGAGYKFVP
jgi:hypothetical protein